MIDLTGPAVVTCVSCAVDADAGADGDAVRALRSFLVRHGDCLTALDLAAFRGLSAGASA